MTKLGVISAYRRELKPLVDGWRQLDLGGPPGQNAWQGRIGAASCVAVSAGMGKNAAARACAIAESASEGLDALVSLGWAGALSCGVYPAQSYLVAEVIDADTAERFFTGPPPAAASPIRLVTVGHVVRAEEKRQLAERFQAVLVDMEAAAVAKIARNKGFAFFCFKAVSDKYGETLPDFSQYSDAQGQIRMPAFLAHAALRPKYWPAMARMGKNAKTGAAALSATLHDFLEQYANHT
jgi:adenosylhomocysteine nucleosidase